MQTWQTGRCSHNLVAEWIHLHYTFLDNSTNYKTESVRFWGLVNSATKLNKTGPAPKKRVAKHTFPTQQSSSRNFAESERTSVPLLKCMSRQAACDAKHQLAASRRTYIVKCGVASYASLPKAPSAFDPGILSRRTGHLICSDARRRSCLQTMQLESKRRPSCL